MQCTRSTRTVILLMVWCCSVCQGCAQMAMVRCWQPAAIDVSGMDRLVVVDFCGPQGDQIASDLNERLRENHFYALVDASELTTLQHAAYVPDACDEAFLAQARERGIDGVVFGHVEEYGCEDVSPEKNSKGVLSAAVAQVGSSSDAVNAARVRHAEVAVTFQLIDTRTGEVRTEKQSRHTYSGAVRDSNPDLSEAQVLAKLTEMCLDEFLTELSPHQSELPMKLACSRWYGKQATAIRSGNRQAIQGNWDAARDLWQTAVDRDAENDAALFNLAIDAAHRQQYGHAEELAMQALKLRHTDQYAEGLARIREYRTGYDAAARQRDRRVLQAAR